MHRGRARAARTQLIIAVPTLQSHRHRTAAPLLASSRLPSLSLAPRPLVACAPLRRRRVAAPASPPSLFAADGSPVQGHPPRLGIIQAASCVCQAPRHPAVPGDLPCTEESSRRHVPLVSSTHTKHKGAEAQRNTPDKQMCAMQRRWRLRSARRGANIDPPLR